MAKFLFGIKGKVIITKKNKNKSETRIIENRIMNDALDEIIKSFYSKYNSDILFKYIAFGDDNTANTNDMEHLVNEIYRVPIIQKNRTGIGTMNCRAILKDTQPEDTGGIATIREVGLFAGTTSFDWLEGVGIDSGLLVSRIVLDPIENKIATEEIQVTWEYEISRS